MPAEQSDAFAEIAAAPSLPIAISRRVRAQIHPAKNCSGRPWSSDDFDVVLIDASKKVGRICCLCDAGVGLTSDSSISFSNRILKVLGRLLQPAQPCDAQEFNQRGTDFPDCFLLVRRLRQPVIHTMPPFDVPTPVQQPTVPP